MLLVSQIVPKPQSLRYVTQPGVGGSTVGTENKPEQGFHESNMRCPAGPSIPDPRLQFPPELSMSGNGQHRRDPGLPARLPAKPMSDTG